MVSAELLHTLRALKRAEKLYLLQVLVSELAQEEADFLEPGLAYPIWSPHNTGQAAETLLKELQAAEVKDHAEC